jgi:hypothetical protein
VVHAKKLIENPNTIEDTLAKVSHLGFEKPSIDMSFSKTMDDVKMVA